MGECVSNKDATTAETGDTGVRDAPVWTNARRGAFGQLCATTLARCPVVAIVGDAGLGKSTMLRAWRAQCPPRSRVFWVTDVTGDAVKDGAALVRTFGLDMQVGLVDQISDLLVEDFDPKRGNYLVIEDAHLMDREVLKDLATLTRSDEAGHTLLQLVLSGDGSLLETLDDHMAFPQAEIVDLPALTAAATSVLFKRRLGAGASVEDAVLESVFDLTGGVPGQIVALADGAAQAMAHSGATLLDEPAFALVVSDLSSAPEPAAPVRDLPPDVNTPDKLPNSITKSEDPRQMLRWAFGLGDEDESTGLDDGTGALNLPRARPSPEPAPETTAAQEPGQPQDLRQALAAIAAREATERETTTEPMRFEEAPQLPFRGNLDPGQFRHGPEVLAGIMKHDRRLSPIPEEALAGGPPMAPPNELKERLLEEETPKRRRGRGVLLVGGLAACFAAGAFGWPEFQKRFMDVQPDAVMPAVAVLPPGPTGIFTDPVAVFAPDMANTGPAVVVPDAGRADLLPLDAVPQAQIASANPYQVDEQSRTAAIIGASMRQQSIDKEADAALSRLSDVEGQVQAAERRLAALVAQEDLVLSDMVTLRNEVTDLEAQAEAARTALAEVEGQRDLVRAEVAALRSEQADLTTAAAEAAARLEAARQDQAASVDALDAARTELAQVIAARDAAAAEEDAAIAELSDLQAQVAALAGQAERDTDALEGLRAEAKAVQADLDTGRAALAALGQERTDLMVQVAATKADLDDLAAARQAAEQDRDGVVDALAALKSELAGIEEVLATRRADRDDLSARIETLDSEREALEISVAGLTDAASAAQAEVDGLTATVDQMRGQVAELTEATTQADRARDAAEAAVAAARVQLAELEAEQERRGQILADVDAEESVLAELAAQRDQVSQEIAALRETLVAEQARAARFAEGAQNARTRLDADKAALAAVQSDRAEAERAVSEYRTELARLATEREAADAAIASAKAGRSAAEADLNLALASQGAAQAQARQIQQEKASLDAQVQQLAAEKLGLETELAKVSAQLAKDTARRSQTLTEIARQSTALRGVRQSIEDKTADLAALEASRQNAEQIVAALTQRAAGLAEELDGLKVETDTTRQKLAQAQAELSDNLAQAAAAREASDAAEETLQQRLVNLTEAEQQLAALQARIRDAQPRTLDLNAPNLVARSDQVVDAALLTAPGLDALSEDQADALRAALIAGYCVADALKAATGRANPFTVRALRRAVGACSS